MDAKLNIKVFEESMKNFEELYNYKATKKQMELYYKYLKNAFTDEEFNKTCESIVANERFFPSVSVFLKDYPCECYKIETQEDIDNELRDALS